MRVLFGLAVAVAALVAPLSEAVAVTVDMRIEGATQTLFEGPVETDVKQVRSASDSQDRVCDTTNGGGASRPSATGALDDATELMGLTWDAPWNSTYDEYYISRVGSDVADGNNNTFWGLYMNGGFANAGGCGTPVFEGDEVLWAVTAFDNSKVLRLVGPKSATVGRQVEYKVIDTLSDKPVEGANVGGATTGPDGIARKVFTGAGDTTLKATADAAIRSNGVKVTVVEPVTASLRIEGATQTLFEGQVETGPHVVRSASDTQNRTCDSTNAGQNPLPGASAIGILDDAAATGGFTWDAAWFLGYDDYFLTRIGPDDTDEANGRYWGLLVDGQFTSVGGCQARVDAGASVLWAYDAFNAGEALELAGPEFADPGELVEFEVTNSLDGEPVQGATIGGLTTGSDGTADVVVGSPGKVSFKATKPGSIRSNRVDVCVQADTDDDCTDVEPVDPPTCQPGLATTDEDTPVVLTLDCEGEDREIQIAEPPNDGSLGEVDQATGEVTYTPDPGFFGRDLFTFVARNEAGVSDVVVFEVEVSEAEAQPNPPDDKPSTPVDPITSAPAPFTITPAGAAAPPKPADACASLKGNKLKRCKALQKCKSVKKKSKRAKCKAKARKIGKRKRKS